MLTWSEIKGAKKLSRLVNHWQIFWRDFNSKENSKFLELPLVQLQKYFDVPWSHVNRGELLRAKWMWSRKPKLVLGEGGFGFALLVFVALLLLLIPHTGGLLTICWCFAMLGFIARDVVRSIRWRRDYEVSIIRIVRNNKNLK